jgi:predicted nucleic acid-binding protein
MTRSLVVDASVAFRLIAPGPDQECVRGLWSQWQSAGVDLQAPVLWLYELASAFCKAVYHRGLTPPEAREALTIAQDLDVALIPPDDTQIALALEWTVRLNRVAAYDSFYLALAESLGCELWTADQRLCNAVDLRWVRYVAGSAGR